jgi:hypothetical protein
MCWSLTASQPKSLRDSRAPRRRTSLSRGAENRKPVRGVVSALHTGRAGPTREDLRAMTARRHGTPFSVRSRQTACAHG